MFVAPTVRAGHGVHGLRFHNPPTLSRKWRARLSLARVQVWDPLLIISQIIALQCTFYISLGLLQAVLLGRWRQPGQLPARAKGGGGAQAPGPRNDGRQCAAAGGIATTTRSTAAPH